MANRPLILALALLVAGLGGGLGFDDAPPRPEVRRGRWRVLEADFHAHTSFSDGSLSPYGLVRQASRRGLDVIGVTEHNAIFPAESARFWSRNLAGPTVVVGQEVTTSRFHVIGLGLWRTVSPGVELGGVLDEIHAQGGVAIAAHPVKRYWPALTPVRAKLDGSEVMHPLAFTSMLAGWRWQDLVTFHEGGDLMAIGSSDYHWGTHLGWCRTLVFADDDREASVLDALRHHRTVVYDRDGKAWGDPEAIAQLAAEPYAFRPIDYSYKGKGPADRVLRIAGWVGILLLVVLERRRR